MARVHEQDVARSDLDALFALGRLEVSAQDVLGYFHGAGYVLLDIQSAHVAAVEGLPMLHADPFDRILVAQALSVPLRLLTRDVRVARYSDTIIMV